MVLGKGECQRGEGKVREQGTAEVIKGRVKGLEVREGEGLVTLEDVKEEEALVFSFETIQGVIFL